MKLAIINVTSGRISGGYKEYLINIIPRLASHSTIESLLCASVESLNVQEWFNPMPNVEFVNCPAFWSLGYKLNKNLQQRIKQFSPDVIFVPVERPFKLKGVPLVTMIQNMEPFVADTAEYSLSERLKCRVQYITGKMAVRSATRVIAISEFVKDFLINSWHISRDKIGLVYYGSSFGKNMASIKPKNMPNDWEREFLFTAGSIRPARGLEDLILAAKSINFDSLGIKGVVIAGKVVSEMLKYKQKLSNLIKANNLVSRFVFLGEIDSSQMKWCYENCRLFVMTSRVEAFVMIGLEAMANTCLCVVADNPCLPETFQDCAVYYKPRDAAGLAGAINSTLGWEETKIVEMLRKTRGRSAEFTWEKTVNALVKELESAAEVNAN